MSRSDSHIRRRVLSEWRGYWEPKPRPDRCREVSEAVGQVMKQWGLGERLTQQQIQGAWSEIVGDFLARHSTPAALRNGVLTVHVLQPAIHYELERMCRQRILDGLRRRFGRRTIRDLRFQLG